ncbi:hypothetical protein FOZ63_026691, partial [Perkinsus olseni]
GGCSAIHILSSIMFYRHPSNSFVSSTPGQPQYQAPGVQYQPAPPQQAGRVVVRNVSGQAASSGFVRQYTPVGTSAANMSSLSMNNVSQHHTTNHLSPRPPPQFMHQQQHQQQQLPHYTTTGPASDHQPTPSQGNSSTISQAPRVQVVKRTPSMNVPGLDQSVAHGPPQSAHRAESPARVQHVGPSQAEVDRIRTELASVDKKLQAATNKLMQKEEEGRRLNAEIDSYKVSEGQFKAALSKLRAENESLASAATASRAPDPKIAELSRRLEGRTAELKRVQGELSSSEDKARRTKQDLDRTVATLRETKEQLESLKAHFEQQSQLVTQDQEMLVTETEAQRAHIAKLEQALQETAQENEMLQLELNSSTTDRSELKVIHEQLRNVEKERDAAMAARDAMADRESALRLDLEAAQKEARKALQRAELAEVKAEGRGYKEDVIKTSNLSHLKQNTGGSSSDGGETSAAAMVRKNRELEDLQEQLDNARDEIASMRSERAALEEARREAEEKLQSINMTVTEATSKNKIVSKLHAEVSDLKREIVRLQEELARYKDMPKNKENRASEFNTSVKSKYLSVAGPEMNATLNDTDGGRYSRVGGSPFAESPMPQKTQRALPSDSTLMLKSPSSAKKVGSKHSSGGRKSKDSPVKIVRARGLLNNLNESDPVVAKALADHRETDGKAVLYA